MSTLILMRHGQASFAQERYDALSEMGRVQALITGERIQRTQEYLSLVVHGPRQRHVDTAHLVLGGAHLNTEVRSDARLDEFAEGEDLLSAAGVILNRQFTNKSSASRNEQLRAYDMACKAWAANEIAIPGRPAFYEFRLSVKNWLAELVDGKDRPRGEHILAVTSAGVIGAAVCEVLGLPDVHWHGLMEVIRNASLTELVFSRDRCSLLTFNCSTHLSTELISSI
ncbi:histidine phosphatase family protein [Pseudomonas sp. MWU12-2312b]|uniref:histidine phosphatase family protein n=1 Tax=Pseudomonas moorei TaxID=395599 RepID=UPI000D4453C3|nr:histidine phosphatase family protein [Pseudomonas moorei]PPA03621.1 histidine phosphatase family protein [Pseudomonas sp. MWU12-2312b]